MKFKISSIQEKQARQLALKLGQKNSNKEISEIDADLEKKKIITLLITGTK